MDNATWSIKSFDPWFDLAPSDCAFDLCNYDSYRRFTNLTGDDPDFVPMISVGGKTADVHKYITMIQDPIKRKRFINSVVTFIQEYGFRGLDLAWVYPVFGDDTAIDDATVLIEGLNRLLVALKAELAKYSAVLSITISCRE